MNAATVENKYLIAKVEKALGFCQFQAKLEMRDGSLRDVTVLVRGKNKGGRNCVTRVEAGCFVMVEDSDPKKVMEIISVANKQVDLDRLRRAARVSDRLAGEEHELDDLFELPEDEDDLDRKKEQKENAERELSRAEELVLRYMQRAEAGVKTRAEADLERGVFGVEDAPEELDDEDDGGAAAGGAPRRRRRVKPLAAPAAPIPTEMDLFGAQEQPEEDTTAAVAGAAYLDKRVVPDRWDDEIDIDAI